MLAARAAFPAPQDTVQTAPAVTVKQPKPKLDHFKGNVLWFDKVHIIVQNAENQKIVRSYHYSIELQSQVIDLINRGGFQHGDKVEIISKPGTTIAVKIKGKPSQPQ
jgi:beta-xylosidase